MATRKADKRQARDERKAREAERLRAARARRLQVQVGGAVIAAVVVLGAIFLLSNNGGSSGKGGSSGGGGGGKYAFAVGQPGPGRPAPAIDLPSTSGGKFNLAARRGRTVLLYFQEGLGCEPCWNQLKDLEPQTAKLRALGVDEVVSITTDDLGGIRQKVSDVGLKTPVLSDPDLAVSKAYSANQYGMMGTSRDGHSFIVVGPSGKIRWRADYGGAPNYTMYVPVRQLLADLRKGLHGGT